MKTMFHKKNENKTSRTLHEYNITTERQKDYVSHEYQEKSLSRLDNERSMQAYSLNDDKILLKTMRSLSIHSSFL